MKIHTVGGFSEVGKNMTVLEVGEDAFIFDEGFYLPPIVEQEEKERGNPTEKKLREILALPNDKVVEKIKHKVRAQFISHAHLDHVGGVPYLSDYYDAPIYGTPFTMEVLNSLLKDEDMTLKNKTKVVNPNSTIYVQGKTKKYQVDFINVTHSTPQTSFIAVHTDEGIFLYACDFKLDDTPILGPKPNYEKLKELSKKGIKAVVIDSLYSGTERKTPSERIAKNLLEEILLTINNKDAGIIITTFSSHIARLKSIMEFAKKLNREPIFLGRSLSKYSMAAQKVKIAPFLKDAKIMKYRRQVEKELKKIEKNRSKYLIVCTGHQGEPGSILERMARNQLHFKLNQNDNIIFSSSVIPTEVNKENFQKMEDGLRKKKVRIFRDAHVSGHAGREDLRDTITLLNPEHIIPWHGDRDKTEPMVNLAAEFGYKEGKNIHLMKDGNVLEI
jgi:ribonuclease J